MTRIIIRQIRAIRVQRIIIVIRTRMARMTRIKIRQIRAIRVQKHIACKM